MKAFGFALLFVIAAVQARSSNVQLAPRAIAQAGENPWVVHLRISADFVNGALSSCAGSLIGETWILTSGKCVDQASFRFVWIRFGALDVIRPVLVEESNHLRLYISDDKALALIELNRIVEYNENIAPIALADGDEVPSSGKFCGYGAEGSDLADAKELACFDLAVESDDSGNILGAGDELPSPFDLGAPLVSGGVQVGVLNDVNDGGAEFVNPSKYREWIESVTEIKL